MPASTEQKVDFLLKKIGYSASKTGGVEGSSGTVDGTKKKPSEEAIPSPLVVPSTSVWADSSLITATPPGSDTFPIKVYATASAYRLTVDNSVSESRSFIARSTYGNASSSIDGDWIDSQFGADYAVRVFKGDPNSGGVELAQAGATGNDTWFFDYSSGILNFTGTDNHSSLGVTDTNIYILGYRYVGGKGAKPPSGIGTFSTLDVSGITTFRDDVEFHGVNAGVTSAYWDKSANQLKFLDNAKLSFGGSNEYTIFHKPDTNDLRVEVSAGTNYILMGDVIDIKNAAGNKELITAFGDNGTDNYVKLSHNGIGRLITTGAGVTVTGVTSTTGLYVTGISTLGVSTFTGAVSIGNSLSFGDAKFIYMGDGNPLEIGHYDGGGHSQIKHNSATADLVLAADRLRIINRAENKDLANFTEGSHVRLYHDGNQRFTTTGYGVSVSALESIGIATFHNNVHLSDNDKIVLGVGKTEFQIYHDGSTSIVKSGEGNLNLQTVSGEVILSNSSGVVGVSYKHNDRVLINHAGSPRFVTTGYGVSVSALESVGIATFHKDVEFVGAGGAGITSAYWDQSASSLKFLDGVKATFGDHEDLKIYHTTASGGYSVISESGTGQLVIGGNLIEFKNEALNTTYASIDQTGIDVTGHTETDTLNVSGISTLGNIGISTGLISGPAITYIDPAAVGDNTGLVVVKGNLQVDGTQTTVNSATMTVTDKNIVVAQGSANDAASDGAGITVDAGSDTDKTFNWVDSTDAWTSSEHIQVAAGKQLGFADDPNTYIDSPSADTIRFTAGGSERVRIQSNGNVGIGTTTDSASRLTLYGSAAVITQNSSTGSGAGNGFYMGNGNGTIAYIWNYENESLRFATDNKERIRITADGKIGINTTGANNGPSAPVHIYGNSDTTPILAFTRNTTHDDWQGAGIGMVDEGGTYKGALTFYTHESSGTKNDSITEKLRITSDGKVGIGITSPDYDLDIDGSIGLTGQVRGLTKSASSPTYSFDGDSDTGMFRGGAINVLSFATAGTERLTIKGDGNTNVAGSLNVTGITTSARLNVTGITTVATLNVGVSGQTLVGITTILDEDNMVSDSATALATQQSIKKYVDDQVTAQDLDITTDSGTIDIDLDGDTLSISGTANEIETSASGEAVTIGLPDNVTIANDLTVTGKSTLTKEVGISSALSVAGVSTFNDDVYIPDNKILRIGGSSDLQLYHTTSNSHVSDRGGVGNLHIESDNAVNIKQNDAEHYMAKFNQGGAVELYNNNTKRFETLERGVGIGGSIHIDNDAYVTGISTFAGNVTLVGAASSNATWDKTANSLKFDDHVTAQFGDGQDLSIYHTGSNSLIKNTTGQLAMRSPQWGVQGAGSEGYNIYCVAGAQIQLYYAGDKKLETLERGVGIGGSIHIDNDVNVAGISTFNDDVTIVNNKKILLGNSSTFSVYASGSDKYIKGSTSGELVIRDDAITMQAVTSTDTYFDAVHGGSVSLYWDNSKKFETLQKGVGIAGSITVSNDLSVTGISTFNNDTTFVGAGSSNTTWDKDANSLKFDDNVKAQFGNGQDLSIYHTGDHTYLDNDEGNTYIRGGGGTIYINATNGKEGIVINPDGSADLYNNDTKRFNTTSTGTYTTGIATASGVINSETDVQINGVSVQTTALNDAVAMAIALG